MKVTDIKAQQRSNRVSVYLDWRYAFSLSLWQLAQEKLRIGDELSKERLSQLKNDSDFGKLYDRTLNWLMIRPRSAWEIEQYLARKTDNDELKQLIKQRIEEKGFINDQDFAERWVRSRRLLKPMSTVRLRQELLKKRVPREIIDETLVTDETSDLETVKQLIIKRRHRYKDQQKLMAYLARQGYPYGVIKDALELLED